MRSSPDISDANGAYAVADHSTSQVTHFLEGVENGDPEAAERLLELVYSELRKLASQKLAGERAGHTLNPTELVHEAWDRLNCDQGAHYDNRAHFFAAAAEAMRRVLIDRARARLAAKRAGGVVRADLDCLETPTPETRDDVLVDVHEALNKFAALHPQKAELVKLRYFVGMTTEEAAEALGIAVITAKKWWAYARAWFRIELG
jgi:RNA polymerase sigma factor (TIGR02999 family)